MRLYCTVPVLRSTIRHIFFKTIWFFMVFDQFEPTSHPHLTNIVNLKPTEHRCHFSHTPQRGFRKHDTHSGYNICDFYLQSCFQAAAAAVPFSLVCPVSSHCCSNSALFLFQVPMCYWNRGGMIRRSLPAKLANPSPAAELQNSPHSYKKPRLKTK